ncbi:hypothetical protein CPB84DRAFT_1752668 [Gymnopilus junonius]|uniref:Uncharacterized protein n=1 Tax=Gymnopilus junonius TaxID=109634 RepID=A0A9P5NAZ9_GYMJU|nr:hypothetical protein CPB84DRAFT_1752668 [Gymnopilus junonius]
MSIRIGGTLNYISNIIITSASKATPANILCSCMIEVLKFGLAQRKSTMPEYYYSPAEVDTQPNHIVIDNGNEGREAQGEGGEVETVDALQEERYLNAIDCKYKPISLQLQGYKVQYDTFHEYQMCLRHSAIATDHDKEKKWA